MDLFCTKLFRNQLNVIHLERFREQRSTTRSHYKSGLWPSQETPPFFLQSVTSRFCYLGHKWHKHDTMWHLMTHLVTPCVFEGNLHTTPSGTNDGRIWSLEWQYLEIVWFHHLHRSWSIWSCVRQVTTARDVKSQVTTGAKRYKKVTGAERCWKDGERLVNQGTILSTQTTGSRADLSRWNLRWVATGSPLGPRQPWVLHRSWTLPNRRSKADRQRSAKPERNTLKKKTCLEND